MAKKSDSEHLLDELSGGLLRKFKNMTPRDKEDFFDSLSPSEFKNFSEMLLRMRPVNVELEREVLSLGKSLDGLPTTNDVMNANARLASELEQLTLKHEAMRACCHDLPDLIKRIAKRGGWDDEDFDNWATELMRKVRGITSPKDPEVFTSPESFESYLKKMRESARKATMVPK